MKFLVVTGIALLAGSLAKADLMEWSYGDWRVEVQTVDTTEDVRITCRARTGGDGLPTLDVYMSNGDAGPPAFYPLPTVWENAPRGYDTVLEDQQLVVFESDAGWVTAGRVTSGVDDSGFAWAEAQPDQRDALKLLQAMRIGQELRLRTENGVFMTASLRGFTAAYGKIAEECGFSVTGVIN